MNSDDRLPVAAEWYTFVAIDDAITLIQEPYADPWISANTWHIRGTDRDLLVDSGLGVAPLRPAIVQRFAGREPIVALTHGHLDHMGGAHEFQEVWAHELEPTAEPGRGTLSGPELLRILGADDVGYGLPAEIMVTAIPNPDYDIGAYELLPVVPTRRLRDGDVIDLGDRRLTVIHLPGHTPGSIALHDRTNRILFTGDVIYDPPALLDDLHGSERDAYVQSMRRLLTLDVASVYSGHCDSFDGDRLRELAQEYIDAVGGG